MTCARGLVCYSYYQSYLLWKDILLSIGSRGILYQCLGIVTCDDDMDTIACWDSMIDK